MLANLRIFARAKCRKGNLVLVLYQVTGCREACKELSLSLSSSAIASHNDCCNSAFFLSGEETTSVFLGMAPWRDPRAKQAKLL